MNFKSLHPRKRAEVYTDIKEGIMDALQHHDMQSTTELQRVLAEAYTYYGVRTSH